MTGLRDILERHVSSGSLPGAVGLVARGDRVEVEAVGSADIEGTAPMVRDSIFRIASLTKPVTAAAVMMLVEEGRFALEDPVDPWLPELASRVVVRTPASPVGDVVPAARPITVFDLLTFRAGYGFPSDFSLPAVGLLFSELKQGPPQPQQIAEPDAWMKALSGIPLLYQPGEAWLYNTCSDILGVLIARVSGQSLPEFLAERIFEPLGMADTGFAVLPADLGRFTSYYRGGDGGLELADAPHGQWSRVPAFPSGTGGLVGTADDWYAFGRMMLAQGALDGDRGRLLSAQSVRQMTTDWLTVAQRSGGELFLEGQGWGFGGSVDVTARDPWNVPGRYGWVGGTGTAAHITPATGAVSVLLTQREMTGPTPPAVMRDFWTYAAGA
ncbi:MULTISPECIES: serine hydrolase domain-containing protein [unclassified Streptomyces]|uniref:serine hydrolase domain-containing protein n=1 Tax=unclassified Streptomyces TaxID=2593676 RepID=UPI00225A37EC|nr:MULTISPECIES: serine hydrolase domain-containing protein [unclassified Streptomyces]MCX4625961.1 beta-lactamase family protein [Streptomyces sp. NBC_01443]WSW42019.1 beta-lactamase family protein [Streptomyces sp. NBC_01001]